MMLSIKNINLQYDHKTVFSDLNLDLILGEWTGLIGASGVGKSSLLRLIAGLIQSKTKLQFANADDTNPTVQFAYMAQVDLLLPWLNVLDNVCLGMRLRNTKPNHEIAKVLLKDAGLIHAINLYPHQLSGGMRQRVALVRTLLEDKSFILMDEPFSALDAITRYKLQELAVKLLKGRTVLFITHDPAEALRLSHRVYLMEGQPAQLNLVASLKALPPRESNHPEVIALQNHLLKQLAISTGAS